MAWWDNVTLGDIGKYGGSTVGALSTGAGYQTLKDINQINKWADMGYGNRNPVPQSMLKNLTGAYVPNKTFEKLGHGKGSLKGWLTGRVHPSHFGPVEAAMNVGKHIGTLGGTVATGIPLAYASLADALQGRLEDQGLTGEGGIADVSGLWGAEAAGADVEYDMDTRPSYSDSAFLGFERGDQGLTSADTFEGINTLPKGRSISEQVYDAQRREALARLATEFEEGKIDSPTKEGWKPNMGWLRTAASFFNPFGDKNPLGAALNYGISKIKPTNTDNTLSLLSRGDPDIGKGLSGKVSWAGRAYDKKHGAGAYKQKQIDDYVTKYKDVNYKTQKMKDKYAAMYAQSTQGKAAAEQAAKTAAGIGPTTAHGGGIDRGDLRDIGGGFHAYSDSGTAAGYEGSFYKGGRVGFSKGGIVDLWQELSNL